MGFVDTLKMHCLALFEWAKVNIVVLFVISAASIIGTILFCTFVITYLPPDYFQSKRRANRIGHPVLRLALKVLKNLFSAVLILVGFVQLFAPGQGILTLLVGVVISDIPGKRKLELRIIRLPVILSAANGIRARFKRPLFVLDEPVE